jgi:Fur family ferric uptake transcriptional regulator
MSKQELVNLIKSLQAQGYRLSGGRELVLSVLATSPRPLRALDILQAPSLKKAGVNRATVYRSLTFLEKIGVLEVLRLDGDERLYHLNLHHHHHLVCTVCKKIEAVHFCDRLRQEEAQITASTGFKVQRHVLEFYGLCKKCLASSK